MASRADVVVLASVGNAQASRDGLVTTPAYTAKTVLSTMTTTSFDGTPGFDKLEFKYEIGTYSLVTPYRSKFNILTIPTQQHRNTATPQHTDPQTS